MKRVLTLLMILCLFTAPALATPQEPALLFKNAEEWVVAGGKALTVRPKLQHTREKAVLTYSSSDEKVATVTAQGAVTGIAPGRATITAVATTASGTYTASYALRVYQPVERIELEQSVSLAPGTRHLLQPGVWPVSGALHGLTFTSSNRSVATVNERGIITAHRRGTATITARATDGSNVRATVKVTVKNYNIVIRSRQGAVIRYPVRSGAWEIDYATENQAVHPMGNDYHSVRVLPLKGGADSLTLTVTYYRSLRTRDYNYSVFVAPDALLYPDDESARQARRSGLMPAAGL